MQDTVTAKTTMIDVSEVKVYRECPRKWAFSSRNKMHLRKKDTPVSLKLGTAFHKAIERMYLGVDIKLNEIAEELEIDKANLDMLEFQLGGYYNNVLKRDLEQFAVVNTEHRFYIPIEDIAHGIFIPRNDDNIAIVGSIDLVYRHRESGNFGGLEHKFIKNFRSSIYDALDEQPKLYFYVIDHEFGDCEIIGINQVRKLKTKFDFIRSALTYTPEQLDNFIENFIISCLEIADMISLEHFPCNPNYMGCQMCDYSELCLSMNAQGTDNINVIDNEEILASLGLEKRTVDHLDEK